MRTPEQFPPAPTKGKTALPAFAPPSLDALAGPFSGWFQYSNRWQAEAVRFVQERFNRDVETMSQFAKCTKPEDIFNVQAKFFSDLLTDYTSESAKIVSMFGEATQEAQKQMTVMTSHLPNV